MSHGIFATLDSPRGRTLMDLRLALPVCLALLVLNAFGGVRATTHTEGAVEVKFGIRTIKLPILDKNDVRFHRISTADGLSQTRVAQIVQDDQGFLWFGTQYGLNRFDGYKFKVFAHDPRQPDSLGGVYITELFKDRSGALWIGGDQFLDRFDRRSETFTHFRLDTGDGGGPTINVHNIYQDSSGMLWISTGKGLYRLDSAAGHITRYTHNPKDNTTIGNNDIKRTGEDGAGSFWVAHTGGMDRFDLHTGKVSLHVPLEDSSFGIEFHRDRFGIFWIIYGEGQLGAFDTQTQTITRYSRIEEQRLRGRWNPFTTMLEDKDGDMWFGTGAEGLLRLDRAKNRFIRYINRPGDNESLSDDRVIALLQDREGNFWTSFHQAGPNFFSKRKPFFGTPAQQAGQPIDRGLVTVLHEDRHGTIWLGTSGGRLRLINRENSTSRLLDITTGADVLAIVEQPPDTLWIATSGNGLKRYTETTGEVTTYTNNPSDPKSISFNMIEKLLISRKGTLWIATWDGLNRFDPLTNRFESFRPQSNARGLNFHAIAEDQDGMLWLGSNLGLHRFDPKTAQFTNYENVLNDLHSLSDNRVNSIFFDHSGGMWVGTQNGLDRFDRTSRRFTTYFMQDGLSGNTVSCILEDRRNILWMSTNRGVSSLDAERRRVKTYGFNDGLPGLDLTGWGACAKGSSGEIFFGGFSGSTVFDPEWVAEKSYAPPIALTDFRLFGEEVKLGQDSPLRQSITSSTSIALAHWQNFFALEFSALSFKEASTNRYRYMLKGLDPRWIQAGSDARVANYTAVPPAAYQFRVQAATSRGTWSEPGATLLITVHPPWWSSWWFRLACLVLFALTIFLSHRLRLRQATDRLHVRFEERLAERTRIARELHDTLLQGFHGLMLRFQAVQNLLPEKPNEARRSLEIAIDRAADAITESRDAVAELRGSAGENSLIETLTLLGTNLAAEQGSQAGGGPVATFQVLVEGVPRQLQPVLQDDLYYISREAIANAFHHARATQIELEVRFDGRALRLRVRDDGIGINRDFLERGGRDGHWGLPGMRERAKTIGAKLDVWSESNRGTEIELIVPATVAYAPTTRKA